MPHSTKYRSFRRRSSQPITWLILTNKTVQENTDKRTQCKSEKVNNLKYSKTKLTWFSCLLQHSARKRGGLILHRPRAHTGLCAKCWRGRLLPILWIGGLCHWLIVYTSAWRQCSSVAVVYQVVGYYVTRECASCGILWCRRTPLCNQQTTDQSQS